MTASSATKSQKIGALPYLVAGCMFMENLDATAIVTALPAMASAFDVHVATIGLAISAYLVAAAVTLPLAPWLAARLGGRAVMACAIVGFVASSILCGVSGNLPAFVAARILQGAAAALMSPVGRLVVLRDTPKSAMVQVVGVLTWPALIAPLLGPPLGGLLTDAASWRWIFFLNVPIGLAGVLLVFRLVPSDRERSEARFDWRGFVLYATALIAGLTGLELLGAQRFLAGLMALLCGGAVGFFAVRHMRRTVHPLIGIAPLSIPSFFVASISGGTLSRIAISATPFLLPLMFQLGGNISPAAAGALAVFYFAGNLVMKVFTTRLLRRFGFRTILLYNGAAIGLTVASCAACLSLPLPMILPILLAAGAARSLQMTALNVLTFVDIPPALTGDAGTLNALGNQIGMGLGIASAAALLGVAASAGGALSVSAGAFGFVWICVAGLGLAAVPVYARLPHEVGAEAIAPMSRASPTRSGG